MCVCVCFFVCVCVLVQSMGVLISQLHQLNSFRISLPKVVIYLIWPIYIVTEAERKLFLFMYFNHYFIAHFKDCIPLSEVLVEWLYHSHYKNLPEFYFSLLPLFSPPFPLPPFHNYYKHNTTIPTVVHPLRSTYLITPLLLPTMLPTLL